MIALRRKLARYPGVRISKERVAWSVAVVAMLFAGLSIGGRIERGNRADARSTAEPAADPGRNRGRPSGNGRDQRPPDPSDLDTLRKRARQALTISSVHERDLGMNLVRDSITVENWKTVWQEHVRQTLEDGRTHDHEWSRTMRRIGEVAGAEAMEYFEHNAESERPGNRGAVLVGWATADPAAAMEWMKQQAEDSPNQQLWSRFIEGVTDGDPMWALEHRGEIPEQHRTRAMAMAADGLVQNRNLDAAADTLSSLVGNDAASSDLAGFYFSLKRRISFIEELGESYPEFETHVPDMAELDAAFEPVLERMRAQARPQE